jgi:hypothetical protein
MRLPYGPLLAFALIGATAFAALYDLAAIAGRMLMPWFGWMFP